MASKKLRFGNKIICALICCASSILLISCNASSQPVGMTLSFESAGRPVTVKRFDPDGVRGPTPGYVDGVAPRRGKQMSFMPGDSKTGMPQYVDVTWISYLTEFEVISDRYESLSRKDQKVPKVEAEYEREVEKNPIYSQRIDLSQILTPELLAKVRVNSSNTQLYLTVMFNNDTVSITAKPEKWK